MRSETFATESVSGTAIYPKSGAGGASTGAPSTVSFVYNAGSGTYTIGSGGRTQVFSAANRDAALSSPGVDVYVRTSGNTIDSLTLTRPGTGAPFNYRYVAGGFWQRTVDETTQISGALDAFVYGVRAPVSAIPLTGTGGFTTELLGIRADAGGIGSLVGEGVLKVDFATGGIDLNGFYQMVDPETGALGFSSPYEGSGALNSDKTFTGTINIFPFTSTLTGQFYGSRAQELGAVFSASDNAITVIGTLLGRRAGSASGQDGLLARAGAQQFDQFSGFLKNPNLQTAGRVFEIDAEGKAISAAFGGAIFDQLVVDYGAGAFNFLQSNSPLTAFVAADRVAADSNASFDVYRTTSGTTVEELTVSRPGATNPTIALTYTGFGNWVTRSPTATAGVTQVRNQWFTHGLLTTALLIPTTGRATYTGLVFGSGQSRTVGGHQYDVDGNFSLTADFATLAVSGTLNPTLTDLTASGTIALGDLPFSGTLQAAFARFDVAFTGSNVNQAASYFVGNFFGPTAEEVGGGFLLLVDNPLMPTEVIDVTGIAVGAQAPGR